MFGGMDIRTKTIVNEFLGTEIVDSHEHTTLEGRHYINEENSFNIINKKKGLFLIHRVL